VGGSADGGVGLVKLHWDVIYVTVGCPLSGRWVALGPPSEWHAWHIAAMCMACGWRAGALGAVPLLGASKPIVKKGML
jgi:hypothetical protein